MTEAGLVDWRIAGRLAGALAGAEGAAGPVPRDEAVAICDAALDRVLDYAALEPATSLPRPELVGRPAWIEANLAGLREMLGPLEARAAAELDGPWPLAGIARRALGATAGAEAGLALGYAARRVLGQYHLELTADPAPPRLLLVEPNLAATAGELGVPVDGFLRWVAVHEQTHAVQFAAVPWLREHLAGLVGRLLDGASAGVDLAALGAVARRVVSTDARRVVRDALRGELARALAGPAQARVLDELQAVMAVVEGHAEHVMDRAAADDPALARMRAGVDARRARRGGLADVLARALGLGMKLRQYELGRRFCDAVAEGGGISALNAVWEEPAALPTLTELERPDRWRRRRQAAFSRHRA